MAYREGSIDAAYATTFQWILSGTLNEPRSSGYEPLTSWLQTDRTADNGIFWIRGKAGSGKSTLMKCLRHDPRLQIHLDKWSLPAKVYIISFFIVEVNASYLQQSLEGLLRALLYQILKKFPSIIPRIFPERWENAIKKIPGPSPGWKTLELNGALLQCFREITPDTNILVLVDGLDEFIPFRLTQRTSSLDQEMIRNKKNGYSELGQLCRTISKLGNVKLLLSSRPLTQFFDSFEVGPQLKLEDITARDIDEFIKKRLEESKRWNNLSLIEMTMATSLVTRIREKALGVFLWVRIVVDNLIQSLTDGDNIHELALRVDSLPEELGGQNGLYWNMLHNILPDHVIQGLFLFKLILFNWEPMHPLDLHFAEEVGRDPALVFSNAKMKPKEIKAHSDRVQDRPKSRCAGLLEVYSKEENQDDPSAIEAFIVRPLHLSVLEFLGLPGTFDRLSSRVSDPTALVSLTPENVYSSLLGAMIIHLKIFGITSGKEIDDGSVLGIPSLINCLEMSREIEKTSPAPMYAAQLDEVAKILNYGYYSICFEQFSFPDDYEISNFEDEFQNEWAKRQFLNEAQNARGLWTRAINAGFDHHRLFNMDEFTEENGDVDEIAKEGGDIGYLGKCSRRGSLLYAAIPFGLVSYVKCNYEQLKAKIRDGQRDKGVSLLWSALGKNWWFSELPLLPNPKIIDMLLKCGADPMEKEYDFDDSNIDTIWNFVLGRTLLNELTKEYKMEGVMKALWADLVIIFLQNDVLELAKKDGSATIDIGMAVEKVS